MEALSRLVTFCNKIGRPALAFSYFLLRHAQSHKLASGLGSAVALSRGQPHPLEGLNPSLGGSVCSAGATSHVLLDSQFVLGSSVAQLRCSGQPRQGLGFIPCYSPSQFAQIRKTELRQGMVLLAGSCEPLGCLHIVLGNPIRVGKLYPSQELRFGPLRARRGWRRRNNWRA